jgi:hypothetical protein
MYRAIFLVVLSLSLCAGEPRVQFLPHGRKDPGSFEKQVTLSQARGELQERLAGLLAAGEPAPTTSSRDLLEEKRIDRPDTLPFIQS